MYAGLYSTKQIEQGKNSQKRTNKTGIPDTVKTRFEEMSGYSYDDVRVHYSSGKPARFMALAYTQGNQIHIAPGQEKYLEHELTHVVQQKEGRVKPTFWINNVPVNDDKSLEREADIHWCRGRDLLPAEGEEVLYQGVLQGQFIKGKIHVDTYLDQIRKIFELFKKTNEKGPWEYCNIGICSEVSPRKFVDNYSTVYSALKNIADSVQELKKDLARLDILKNLVEHCIAKPSDTELSDDTLSDNESPESDPQYEHYHLYENGIVVYDNNNTHDAGVVYDDDNTYNENVVPQILSAAIDCRYMDSISKDDGGLYKVFWIESFVSFQKGKGKQLLKEIFSHKNTDQIDYVALGAYPGTEKYYQDELGMCEAPGTYVLDDGGRVVNESEALQKVIEFLKDSLEDEDMSRKTKEELIDMGKDDFYLYPLYYVSKSNLLSRLGIEKNESLDSLQQGTPNP